MILNELISFSKPLHELSNNLSKIEWDFEGEPLVIEEFHIRKTLKRFIANEISATDLEEWANLIESREDLKYADKNHAALDNTVFCLANPTLQGTISASSCEKLLIALENGSL